MAPSHDWAEPLRILLRSPGADADDQGGPPPPLPSGGHPRPTAQRTPHVPLPPRLSPAAVGGRGRPPARRRGGVRPGPGLRRPGLHPHRQRGSRPHRSALGRRCRRGGDGCAADAVRGAAPEPGRPAGAPTGHVRRGSRRSPSSACRPGPRERPRPWCGSITTAPGATGPSSASTAGTPPTPARPRPGTPRPSPTACPPPTAPGSGRPTATRSACPPGSGGAHGASGPREDDAGAGPHRPAGGHLDGTRRQPPAHQPAFGVGGPPTEGALRLRPGRGARHRAPLGHPERVLTR